MPYTPPGHLQISTDPVREGDYAMLAGYPGVTFRHRMASEFAQQIQWQLPSRVALYGDMIKTIDAASASDAEAKVRYAAQVGVVADGGRVVADGGLLRFEGCRALTIVLAAATNYAPTATDFIDRKVEPTEVAAKRLQTALSKPVQALRDAHVTDHRTLFDSMQVDLGASTAQQRRLDTWARLQARSESKTPDPEFEATYLQFGRYLTIAGSRDGLPTNLQGLWITSTELPWFSDYHTDINVQMNYWLPDRAGLGGQCFEALADYCVQRLALWTQITRERFN
ncbi:S46 family peptidase, partial [Lysobacter sp. 2RAB21]